jgi:hypothetical protein
MQRQCLLAFTLVFMAGGLAAAAPKTVEADGFSLRFDDAQWAQQTAAPPSMLTLRCVAAGCAPANVATFVRDERPLIAPGAAPFGPGAASGAAVDLRLQSLTPASRLLARAPVEPVILDEARGYRGLYDIEDRALAKSAAVIVLLRQGHGTLEIRMGARRLSASDIAAFDALLTGFQLQK